ncbi:MAG: flagellar hook-basal body complex protein FliE [Burkholderiales bacterium]|nr:flagellar hook-basal body complex protein FliE [Burkholderiales bacterium]
MTVESMAPIGALIEPDKLMAAAKPEVPAAGFGDWFSNELNAVNDRLIGVDRSMQQLAVGGTQNLHEVMINMEEARLSFQLLVQVRNRLLEAYQEVMRMQV